MKFRKIKISILAIWLLCMGIFILNIWAKNKTSFSQPENQQVKEIAGYKNWTKVNAAPKLMPARTAASCFIGISPSGVSFDDEKNPHRDKYITVYVNDIGRRAMLEQKNPKFPVGSVIVKEKLPNQQSKTPELLTVMIKQKKGYNPEIGDWEFMVVDGSGTKVEGRGALENCQACHLAYKERDYIFRTYLSSERKLK